MGLNVFFVDLAIIMPVFRNNQHQHITDSILFASYSLSILHPDDIAFAVKFYGVFGVHQIVPIQVSKLPKLLLSF